MALTKKHKSDDAGELNSSKSDKSGKILDLAKALEEHISISCNFFIYFFLLDKSELLVDPLAHANQQEEDNITKIILDKPLIQNKKKPKQNNISIVINE